ncbi:16S rRNA (cytosine(1402)-N(4))-methyltransferase RsmH [Mycoplasmoides alvi]|uniref:16S rRNA (cytosine(1402)-N(4))-methyltransferase RsmH n=1 Tax=Mycoplasmoides alvi TaxID=78580 RepID=UPI00051C27D0|nr:16S rRNA (cytosine(1402)-N(4))-methyltransferase RsmH [Mycoplasmoides alvi]
MTNKIHQPVLLKEVIDNLQIDSNLTYCDFTIGYGGHASEILKKIKKGVLIGFDQDPEAIRWCENNLNKDKLILVNDNFLNFSKYLYKFNINFIDRALLDLGVSSLQFDCPNRGFSYKHNGPFDMRMNQTKNLLTAEEYVRKNNLNHLIQIFKEYGEIKNPIHVAKVIKKYIDENRNVTTLEISNLIKKNVPTKMLYQNKHPARLYFQALRIAVNNELNILKQFLDIIPKFINLNGILAIITFHSLEEKIVIKKINELCSAPNLLGVPINNTELIQFEKITKKPITPTNSEIEKNYRSRSSKLFVIKRIKICTT